MKTLIRFSAIAMILAMLLCAAGCGEEESAAATTKATQAPTQATEEAAPAPTEEVAVATDSTETTAPSTAEQPTTEQPTATEPTSQETIVDVDEIVIPDEELLPEEDFGVGPLVTVTWKTYESMTDAEKAAYRACFSNDRAFEDWSEMAFMVYETETMEDELLAYGSLDLKAIIEYLTGETFA